MEGWAEGFQWNGCLMYICIISIPAYDPFHGEITYLAWRDLPDPETRPTHLQVTKQRRKRWQKKEIKTDKSTHAIPPPDWKVISSIHPTPACFSRSSAAPSEPDFHEAYHRRLSILPTLAHTTYTSPPLPLE